MSVLTKIRQQRGTRKLRVFKRLDRSLIVGGDKPERRPFGRAKRPRFVGEVFAMKWEGKCNQDSLKRINEVKSASSEIRQDCI